MKLIPTEKDRDYLVELSSYFDGLDKKYMIDKANFGTNTEVLALIYQTEQKLSNRGIE